MTNTKTYTEKLADGVSREEAAAHRHFLKHAMAMKVSWDRMLSHADAMVPNPFTGEEREALAAAQAIIEKSMYPVALVKTRADAELVILED